jgi:hypothetical protein
MHVVVSAQQLASRHVSHVGLPLVSPQEPGLGPGPGPGPGPGEGPPQALPHDVLAHVESAVIFEVPAGCAASHAASHALSPHALAQSMSAMHSASLRQAFASAQQLVSRQLSHAGVPLSKPHALLDGGDDEPPPHAVEQLFSTHVESVSKSAAPVGCAEKHVEKHASSLQASPHATSAVQSASPTQAVFSAQQLAPRHESQVGSPVARPQVPPLLPDRRRTGVWVIFFCESAAIADALPTARATASFDFHSPSGAAGFDVEAPGSAPRDSVVVVSVTVQAHASVDVMAITPKVMPLMCSSEAGLNRARSLGRPSRHRVIGAGYVRPSCAHLDAKDVLGVRAIRKINRLPSAGTGVPPRPRWRGGVSSSNEQWSRTPRSRGRCRLPPRGRRLPAQGSCGARRDD